MVLLVLWAAILSLIVMSRTFLRTRFLNLQPALKATCVREAYGRFSKFFFRSPSSTVTLEDPSSTLFDWLHKSDKATIIDFTSPEAQTVITMPQLRLQVLQFGCGLRNIHGVAQGSTVAIIAHPCIESLIAIHACLTARLVPALIHPDEHFMRVFLDLLQPAVVICDASAIQRIPTLIPVIAFGHQNNPQRPLKPELVQVKNEMGQNQRRQGGGSLFLWADIESLGRNFGYRVSAPLPPPTRMDIALRIPTVADENDQPEVVSFTHENCLAAIASYGSLLGCSSNDRYVALTDLPLPVAFLLECVFLRCGMTLAYPRGGQALSCVHLVQPTLVTGGVTWFADLYKTCVADAGKPPLMNWLAKNIAFESFLKNLATGSLPTLWSCYGMGARQRDLQECFGANVRMLVCLTEGGMPACLKQFLMTHFRCPVVCCHPHLKACGTGYASSPDILTCSTAGVPLPGVVARVHKLPSLEPFFAHSPIGELVMYGQCLNNRFRSTGFCTGELVRVHLSGSIDFVERLTNVLVLRDHFLLFPSKLEALYRLCPDVLQLLLYGEPHNFRPVAVVVVPSESNVTVQTILHSLHSIADRFRLHPQEYIAAIHLIVEPFTVNNGLCTDSGRLRRKKCLGQYKEILSNLCQRPEAVL